MPSAPGSAPAQSLPCARVHGDLWFSELPAELEQAKAHCHQCQLRTACLAGALERGEPCGVWGGEILHQGAIIARKRPRGRPPRPGPMPGTATAGTVANRAGSSVHGASAGPPTSASTGRARASPALLPGPAETIGAQAE